VNILEERLANDAQAEQAAAAQTAIGRMQASYYRGLIEGGVPEDVAGLLLEQMAWVCWHKIQYPDSPPMVMPGE